MFYNFYPPKGVCERRSPEGVHFSKLIQERNLTHQFQRLISAFLKSEKCFIWWVGGWVGRWVGCDILPPSIIGFFFYSLFAFLKIGFLVANSLFLSKSSRLKPKMYSLFGILSKSTRFSSTRCRFFWNVLAKKYSLASTFGASE